MNKIFCWSISPLWWKSEYWDMTLEEKAKFGIYPIYIEYNTNTSAGHPIKDDDIVRTLWKHKELRNKESVR